MKKQIIAGLAAAVAVLSLGACSVVSTQFDEVALHYAGGATSSKTFKGCVPVSKRETFGPSDKNYIYPANQRSFDFTGDGDSESGPIVITAKGTPGKDGAPSGSAQVLLPGVVTFTLNTDCAVLRQFHEKLGNKYAAWWGGSDFEDKDDNSNHVPDGWENMLKFVWGTSLKNVAQDIGSEYTWQQLYNDSAKRIELQGKIQEALNTQIKKLDGSGNVDFFLAPQLTLNQPDLASKALKEAQANQQANVAKANSQKQEADARAAAAEAEVAVAKAEAAKLEELIKVLGPVEANKRFAIEKGINPYPGPVVPGSANK